MKLAPSQGRGFSLVGTCVLCAACSAPASASFEGAAGDSSRAGSSAAAGANAGTGGTEPSGAGGASGPSVNPSAGAPIVDGPAPPLNVQLLAVTYVGGPGDQYIRDIEFDAAGNITARAATFSVTYTPDGQSGSVEGDVAGQDPEPFDDRWFPIGQELDDPRNGQHYSIGFHQVHPILQHPYVVSSAGWKLWDFTTPPQDLSGEQLLDMQAADSRCYSGWLLPGGLLGFRCYTDGGNSFLNVDPHDPNQPATFTQNSNPGGPMSKGSVLYAMADPSSGEILSGVWVHKQRPSPSAVDMYGRAYNTRVATEFVPLPAENTFGHYARSPAGLIIIDPTYTHYELNVTLGGTCTEENETRQRFRFIALRNNIAALGGITCAHDLKTTDNAVQHEFGGGNHDAMLMILKLWD